MDIPRIRGILASALPVRVPRFDPTAAPQAKVRGMEDYLLETARVRGDLEEALHWCLEAEKLLARDWEGVVGYEVVLKGATHTKEQVNSAKRTVRPDLWPALQEAKSLSESLGRQIRRLELDYQTVSRVYSLMSGT